VEPHGGRRALGGAHPGAGAGARRRGGAHDEQHRCATTMRPASSSRSRGCASARWS
jgi:hypothetical protein